MTKIICERRDCKYCVDSECSENKIEIGERTYPPDEEIAVCKTFKAIAGVC